MKLRNWLVIVATLLALPFMSKGQYPPRYFGDTATKINPFYPYGTLSKSNAFYMYAKTKSAQGYLLNVLIKTDTAGNHIWTAYPYNYAYNDSLEYNGLRGSFQLITGSDNALYMLNACDSPYYFNSGGQVEVLSRIDDNTGEVSWVRKITDYGLQPEYLRVTDYSATELLLSSYRSNNQYSILKIAKATGQTIDTRNFPAGPINFDNPGGHTGLTGATQQFYLSAAGSLYFFTSDSCYKYTSFDNNTLEWKIKFNAPYGSIRTAFEDNDLLYVAGNKRSFGESGLIHAINMNTGNPAWTSLQAATCCPSDLELTNCKLKNNHLFIAWASRTSGSNFVKCLVTCTDKTTGTIVWNNNYNFNSDTTYGGSTEAMVSLDVDDSETLFLTGYVPHPISPQYDWGIMKINGLTGQLLGKRRVPKIVTPQYSDDKGVHVKQYGTNLYQVGWRTTVSSGIDSKVINLLRTDTATLTISSIKNITAQVQYPSVTQGIRDYSFGKKIIVKNVGKTLVVEMATNTLGTLWNKALGNGVDYYEGTPAIGISIAKRIFVAAKRYKVVTPDVWTLNEYHCPFRTTDNDSTFIFELDSAGILQRTYRYLDNGLITPLRIVTDTPSTRSFFEYYLKNTNASLANTFYHYTFIQGEGTWGNSTASTYGRIPFLKMRNMHHLPNDTLVSFQTSPGGLTFMIKNRYLSGGQNFFSAIPRIKVIYDVEKAANSRFYLVGQDSLKNDFVMALNSYGNVTNGTIQIWRNTYDTLQNTIKVMAMDTMVYTLVKRGKDHLVQCYSAASGALLWSSRVPVPVNHYLIANDFTVNRQQKTVTVLGGVKDSTGNFNHSICYAYTFTDQGAERFLLSKEGNKMWLNEGTMLYVDRDNRTLAGGRIHYTPFGYAGFILAADQAAGYITAANGNWNDPATWVGNIVPPPDAAIIIRHAVTVTADATCYSITVEQPNGAVNINANVHFTVTH